MTDHQNLKYFTTTKQLNRRQVRWSHFLADFNFTLEHRPGRLNRADLLSRRVQDELSMGDKEHQNQCLLPPERFKTVDSNMFSILATNNPLHELTKFKEEVVEANKQDKYFQSVIDWLEDDSQNKPNVPPGSGKLPSRVESCDNGDISTDGFYINQRGLLFYNNGLYILKVLCVTILMSRHDSVLSGHFGIRKTLELILREFWWPRMAPDVEEYVKTCMKCQMSKPSRQKVATPSSHRLSPWTLLQTYPCVKISTV